MGLVEWQAQQKALKDAERDNKKNASSMLRNYKGGEHDIKEHQKQQRALKVAELDRKKNASKMLHNYKGGEHDIKDYERAVTKTRKENRENTLQGLSRVSTHSRTITAESHHSSDQASETNCNPQTPEVVGDEATEDTAKQKASEELDATSHSTHTTRPLSVDDNPFPQTEDRTSQEEKPPVDNNKDDNDNLSEQSMAEPPAKEPSELEIKEIRGTDDGVTLELGNGNRVTLTPDQVQQLFDEQNNLITTGKSPNNANEEGTKSNNTNEEGPKSNNANEEAPKSNNANEEAPKSMRKIQIREGVIVEVDEKDLRRSTMSLLSGTDMFEVSESTLFEEASVASKKPKKSKKKLKSKKNMKSKKSMSLLSTTDLESSNSFSYEDDSDGSKKPRKSKKPKKKPKKSKKKKSLLDDLDSLSDDSSTQECMTNLIDPGDVMKIYGFQKKPKMNGAMVEAIRKSKESKGARWDVRVLSEEHTKYVSAKRLISVATNNLKHFM